MILLLFVLLLMLILAAYALWAADKPKASEDDEKTFWGRMSSFIDLLIQLITK